MADECMRKTPRAFILALVGGQLRAGEIVGTKPRKVALPFRHDACVASFYASYVRKIHVVDRISEVGCALPFR